MALQARSAATHLLAADVAMARRDPTKALAALRKAHEVQPSTGTVMRLFIHQVQHGATPAAMNLAESWLAKNPQDFAVREALANQWATMSQWGAAKAQYERLLQAQPRNATVLNHYANVLLSQKDLKGALAAAERARQAQPEQAMVLDTLGWIYHQQGQSEKALGLLRDARLRAPDHAEIRYHLAAVLAKLGRRAEAKAEIEAALSNPTGLESLDPARTLAASLK